MSQSSGKPFWFTKNENFSNSLFRQNWGVTVEMSPSFLTSRTVSHLRWSSEPTCPRVLSLNGLVWTTEQMWVLWSSDNFIKSETFLAHSSRSLVFWIRSAKPSKKTIVN